MEKNKIGSGTGASNFQSLEKSGAQTSNDWKSAKYAAWLAAFIAAFCASAFVIVAKCLLRQGADFFSLNIGAVSIGAGFIAGGVLMIARRSWICPLAAWLAAAGAFASAWCFAFLAPPQLYFAIVPLLFFSGVLLGTCCAGNLPTIIFAAAGAAVAQPAVVLLIPKAGYSVSLYALAGLLALAFFIVAVLRRVNLFAVIGGVAAFIVAGYFAPGNLARVSVPDGWQLAKRIEGLNAAVMLIEKQVKPGQPMPQRLILDNRYVIAGQLGFGEKRLGDVPLLLQPAAKTVLFLNANAGVSMAAAKSFVGLEKIDCVEPLAEVAAFLPQFAAFNDEIYREPRAKFFNEGIRSYFKGPGPAYDVIIANPTPPSREDARPLFTQNFYRDVKARLAPGGVFMQWLPLFQTDEANLKVIVRTFASEFEQAQGFIGIYNGELPVFGLCSRANGPSIPQAADIEKVLQPNSPARAFVADVRDLFGSRLLDQEALVTFAGEGALNSDTAPALKFSRQSRLNPQNGKLGGELLGKLLALTTTNGPPDSLVAFGDDARLRDQIAKRTETLRHFLAGDILRASGDANKDRDMIAEYLLAYDSEPDLAMVRAMLQLQTIQRPNVSMQIYLGMLKHNPDDKHLKEMVCTTQEMEARRVGVPIPPTSCGPGFIPRGPPTVSNKFMTMPRFPSPRSAAPPAPATTTNVAAPPITKPQT